MSNDQHQSGGGGGLPTNRRSVLAAGTIGLGLGGGLTAVALDEDGDSGSFADAEHDHGGGDLGASDPVESITARRIEAGDLSADSIDVEESLGSSTPLNSIAARSITAGSVNDVRHVHAGAWDDRLQDEIDDAAADGERHLVVHGVGTFEPTTTVYLPDDFTLRIDDNVRLVPPEDHELDELDVGLRTYRTLVTNADHDAGNENVAIEGGSVSFENVEWEFLSHAPVWFHNCIEPRQEGVTVEDVAYDHGNQSGTRQFGVYLSECEGGIQKDCVARRVGYDGIANRGYVPNRTCQMIGCEAYDIPGTGIQIAGDVRNRSTPSNAPYLDAFEIRDCKTDAYITVHSGGDGATDGIIRNNDARVISLIADGSFDNVTIRDNVYGRVLVAIRDEITNLTIRGHQSREGGEQSSIRLIGYGGSGFVDRLTVAECFSRDRTFIQNELSAGEAVENVRVVDNVFDPLPADGSFVDGSLEPHFPASSSMTDFERVDVFGNTIHDATVFREGVDTVRMRDNVLVDVDTISSEPVPRLLRNDRGTNEGDPSEGGQWNGYADFAEESNAVIRDTVTDDWYRAVDGSWVRRELTGRRAARGEDLTSSPRALVER